MRGAGLELPAGTLRPASSRSPTALRGPNEFDDGRVGRLPAASQRLSMRPTRRVSRSASGKPLELVQRVRTIRRPRRSTCSRARAGHPVRDQQCQLLGDHAAEGDPEHRASIPAHRVEQTGRVVVRSRPWCRAHRACPNGRDRAGRRPAGRTSAASGLSKMLGSWRRSPPLPLINSTGGPDDVAAPFVVQIDVVRRAAGRGSAARPERAART